MVGIPETVPTTDDVTGVEKVRVDVPIVTTLAAVVEELTTSAEESVVTLVSAAVEEPTTGVEIALETADVNKVLATGLGLAVETTNKLELDGAIETVVAVIVLPLTTTTVVLVTAKTPEVVLVTNSVVPVVVGTTDENMTVSLLPVAVGCTDEEVEDPRTTTGIVVVETATVVP